MQLIGSQTEATIRSELLASQQALSADPQYERLSSEIRKLESDFKSVFILNWTPEQAEDIFLAIVNGKRIFRIEISRHPDAFCIASEELSVHRYRKGLSRHKLIQLQLAIELSEQHQ